MGHASFYVFWMNVRSLHWLTYVPLFKLIRMIFTRFRIFSNFLFLALGLMDFSANNGPYISLKPFLATFSSFIGLEF